MKKMVRKRHFIPSKYRSPGLDGAMHKVHQFIQYCLSRFMLPMALLYGFSTLKQRFHFADVALLAFHLYMEQVGLSRWISLRP